MSDFIKIGTNPLELVSSGSDEDWYKDQEFLSFHDGKTNKTSDYHFYAGHLSNDKPHGILIHLHGDGAYEAKHKADKYYMLGSKGILTLARRRNMILLVPRTPDRTGTETWWENMDVNILFLSSLVKHVCSKVKVDYTNFWFSGFSGGAETLSYGIVPYHMDKFPVISGGAIMMGGGGSYEYLGVGTTDGPKRNFSLSWYVGDLDDGLDHRTGDIAGDGFNAKEASIVGESHFRLQGWDTKLEVIPNRPHLLMDYYDNAEYGYYIDKAFKRSSKNLVRGNVKNIYLANQKVYAMYYGSNLIYLRKD